MNTLLRKWFSLFVVMILFTQTFYGIRLHAVEPTSPIVLDNGYLRFGTGYENSINSTGNLQQPFYKSMDGSARKLTFSSYPLDFELMEGGDGTQLWNRNGSSLLNPQLQNQIFDFSGYSQTANGGYGTIITSGTLSINGKLVQITHEYVLPQDKFLIKITTTLKNLSDSTMTNLRYWVGTQDDYIGNNDSNFKTKGNIIDGEFVAITNQNEQSKALKIFNNNEGVLFYTNSDQANTIVGQSYGWYNIQYRNPIDTPINVSGDNSYAFYVRFDDLAPSQETQLNWYYAAGTIADLEQIIQDVYDSVQLGRNITNNSIEFEVNETRNATTYYVVLPANEPAPSQEQIINGQKSDNSTADISGQVSTLANQPQLVNITNLTPGTQYKIYIAIQYTSEEIVVLDPLPFETTNRYTYTFDTDGGSTIEPITQDVGTPISISNPTRTGYTFLGWDQDVPSTMTSEDMTFTALWQINTYQLTLIVNGRDDATYNVVYNALAQEPEAPTLLGYSFGGWYKEVGLVNPWNFETQTMPAHDVALYVKWIANTDTAYQVEYYHQNINDDDYTRVESDTLYGTTDSTVTADEKSFDGFVENLLHPQRLISANLNSDGSLVLKRYYDRHEYTVVFQDWDGTVIETHLVRHGGTLVEPQEMIREGYTFKGWDQDISTITSNMTLIAHYLSIPTIEVSENNLEALIQGLDEAIEFSDEERQERTSIKLNISLFESSYPEDQDILNDYILNTLNIESSTSILLDISLFKLVGDQQFKMSESHHPITISFVIPENFKDRVFKLVHIHNNQADLLEYEYDRETMTITFTVDKFSTFALLYDNDEPLAQTSDASTLPWALLLLAFGSAFLFISRRKTA